MAYFGTGLPPTNTHNTRSAKLTFHIPHAGVLHGLAGYFEAMLYGDVGLSIHPLRKDQISKDMLSWFPLFFPLKVWAYLVSVLLQLTSSARSRCTFRVIPSFKSPSGASRINAKSGTNGMPSPSFRSSTPPRINRHRRKWTVGVRSSQRLQHRWLPRVL